MHRLCLLSVLVLWGVAASAQTRTGTLATGDDRLSSGEFYDTYTVQAEPGQTISADLTSSEFDPYLIVRAPSGAQEDNDDFEGSTTRSHLVVEATEGGTYTISVTSYQSGETGRYRLDLTVNGEARRGATRGRPPTTGSAVPSARGELVGHWVGAATGATQYQDRTTGASAPTNGVGTTLDLAPDGTYRQSRVMQQTTYSCTSVVHVDERGTYTVRGDQLVLTRQSGRSWGQVCGGSRYDRALEPETDGFTVALSDGGATLTRYADGEYFDTLARE